MRTPKRYAITVGILLNLAIGFTSTAQSVQATTILDASLRTTSIPSQQQRPEPPRPEVSLSSKNDVSPPLASIQPIPPDVGEPREIPIFPLPHRVGTQGNSEQALIHAPVGPLMPGTSQNFDGVNNVNGVLPPDTNGDVGPNHYVQMVNLSFAIYSKTGTKLYGPTSNSTLWSGFGGPCQTNNDGDPIVLYDEHADRWLMSQFAFDSTSTGPFYQCITISQTGDPTGAWYRYQFLIHQDKLNDYAKFGVWPDAYYMAVNQFNEGSFSWGGQGVVAFERDKMLLGQPAQMVYFDLFGVDPNLGGMLPSDLDGPAPPAGSPNYFVQADDDAWGYSADQLQIWQFTANWSTPPASTFTFVTALPTANFDSNLCNYSRNCIPQKKTGRKLDAISDRLMYRLQYRNFGTHQTLVTNHTVDVNGADRAGIRWYELRNDGSGWGVHQQATYSPDSNHRWMGSIAMDKNGNMALGYSISSKNMFPSIRYVGRLAGDPLNTLPQGESTLIAGGGSQLHAASRWGDYSMMAVDPTDGCTFWYTTEYYNATSLAGWRTRIGTFKFPSCN